MVGEFLESFKTCLALQETWFSICQPNLIFLSLEPISNHSEDLRLKRLTKFKLTPIWNEKSGKDWKFASLSQNNDFLLVDQIWSLIIIKGKNPIQRKCKMVDFFESFQKICQERSKTVND